MEGLDKLQSKIIADLERFKIENQEALDLADRKHSEWKVQQEKGFKDVYKRVKSYLKSKGLIIPKKDFGELFSKYYIYFEKNREVMRSSRLSDIWEIKPMTESDIVRIAQELTKEVKKETSYQLVIPNQDVQLDLKTSFINKGMKESLEEVIETLFNHDLISEDRSTWIGTKMNGKSQLASVIKFIGLKYLQMTFSVKDVQSIALNTFNTKISIATIKSSPSSNGEYYFLNNNKTK